MRLGLFLKKIREQSLMTQQEAAQRAHVSVGGVSRLERVAIDLDDVHPSTLAALAKVYNYPSRQHLVEHFRHPSQPHPNDPSKLPPKSPAKNSPKPNPPKNIGQVHASGLIENLEYQPEGDDSLPFIVPTHPDAYALKINGPSMEPVYHDGEFLLLTNLPINELQNGEDAMIQLDGALDSQSTFKRVYRRNEKLLLVPLNPNFQPFEIPLANVIRAGRIIFRCTPVNPRRE